MRGERCERVYASKKIAIFRQQQGNLWIHNVLKLKYSILRNHINQKKVNSQNAESYEFSEFIKLQNILPFSLEGDAIMVHYEIYELIMLLFTDSSIL